MASIIQIDGKWRAQVRRKGHPTQTKTWDTKVLAQRWAREIEAAIDKGSFRDARDLKKVTIGDLIRRYRLETRKEIGRSKADSLRQLENILGDDALAETGADRLVRYAEERGVSSTTWGMEFSYLGKIFRIARQAWKIPVPADIIEEARETLELLGHVTPTEERERRPSADELDRLCAYFNDNPRQRLPMADIIRFAVATAMRAGEIMGLRWADLDVAGRTILIRDRKDPKRKKGNNQLVPLLPDAMTIVLRQPRIDDRIFPWPAGTLSTIFPRACEQLGIVDLRFHDLRHEGTSRLFEMGYDIPEVAVFTGHKTWAQLKRYTQLRADHLHRDVTARRPWVPQPNVTPTAMVADARQALSDAINALTAAAEREDADRDFSVRCREAAERTRRLMDLHGVLLGQASPPA